MHYGIYLPNFGPFGDARALADLDAFLRGRMAAEVGETPGISRQPEC